ncbi:glycosyltransferase family 2 protein [Roseovarius sp. EL26]|uniref:glycosyltransferase family 2 protein n=1 Tax=Roseovarius sp. EL26 TaxID=2126672 RepID=UPI000EA2C778|nr:glycosyltransferase family 2 protein [Roseovarius sp. EL26]
MTGILAITMAGRGSRFTKVGYTRPKYEIEAHGIPLFDWSILSLMAFHEAGYRFMFLARSGCGATAYIQKRAEVLGLTDVVVKTIDDVTDGQATSAYLLAENAPEKEPFAVYNIDTFVDPKVISPPSVKDMAGWIPCFPAPGTGWSFARTDAQGTVVELREKKRISDHATVGLYWFDSAARYCSLYETYFATPGQEEMGERYIAPLYNQMIAEGAIVQISQIALEDVGMLGTPEQVDDFVTSPPAAALRYMQARLST